MNQARPTGRRPGRIAVVLLVVLLLLTYGIADVADVVPGPLTNRPGWPTAAPFPSSGLPNPQVQGLPGFAAEAPVPQGVEFEEALRAFRSEPIGAGAGLLIRDVSTAQVLAEQNAQSPRVPASTTKLLTAAAALLAAGPEYRFSTTAWRDGETITLQGGGDLMLAAGAGNPTEVNGRAGLADLAQQVLQSVGPGASLTLRLDESLYVGPKQLDRWVESDFNDGSAMVMSPLAIDLGHIEGSQRRQSDPGMAAAQAFSSALEAAGLRVDSLERGTATGEQVGQVHGAPLAEVARVMLTESQNQLAEAMGRLTAQVTNQEVSFTGAQTAITNQLRDLGVEVAGLRLADDSGLSGENQISPQTLTDLATKLAPGGDPRLLAAGQGLPMAGLDGTLRNRFTDSPAAGRLIAKTGSLNTVASLAGLVQTVDGRLLSFAVMTDFETGDLAQARRSIDGLLSQLAACGCR